MSGLVGNPEDRFSDVAARMLCANFGYFFYGDVSVMFLFLVVTMCDFVQDVETISHIKMSHVMRKQRFWVS